MRIIDLLNMISKGEEVPKKIKYDDKTYIFNNHNGYLDNLDNNIGYYHILDACLNDEVEIIEEDKKIKKLNYRWEETENGYEICDEELVNKINEIIDVVNKSKEER